MKVIMNRWTYRALLGVVVLLCALPELYGQQRGQTEVPVGADSVFVFTYRPQVRMFETRLGNNRRMLNGLAATLQTFRKGTDTLYVEGYAGALGNERANRGTAFWRCINLKGYLINTQQMRECDFKTRNYPYEHDKLGEVVLLSLSPFGVSKVNPTEEVEQATIAVTAERKAEEAAQVVSEVAVAVADKQPAAASLVEPTTQTETDTVKQIVAQVVTKPQVESQSLISTQITPATRKPLFALKTNLLFDAATLLNVELEVPIGKRWSVAGEWIFPWWLSENKQHCLQGKSGHIEGRYWLGNREISRDGKPRQQLTGWFAGLYTGGGNYDLEWERKGYQGSYFITAGISGGYAHTINKKGNLRMEYSLGIGYMQTDYRKYEAEMETDEQWHLYGGESSKYTWFGPTRAKVSLVWMLNYNKKGGVR